MICTSKFQQKTLVGVACVDWLEWNMHVVCLAGCC